jgi:hypothetical protein
MNSWLLLPGTPVSSSLKKMPSVWTVGPSSSPVGVGDGAGTAVSVAGGGVAVVVSSESQATSSRQKIIITTVNSRVLLGCILTNSLQKEPRIALGRIISRG